jgi:imidazolonepropionase-like amidohydrolase
MISGTGGHGDPTNGYRKDLMDNPGPKEGVANGVADCRKAVRQQVKEGADVIKIAATGGALSVAQDGRLPQYSREELEALIQTAHDFNLKVAAHAHGTEGMKRAVEAGVNSIEHGTFMSPEVMDLMKERGTYYVPTITAGVAVADSAQVPGFYPEVVRPKALEIGPQIRETFEKAYESGVKIAFGTDAGVFAHGKNALEFRYMVEGGMPPREAIRAATVHAADLLGVSDSRGTLEAGKQADVIAVSQNPLEAVTTLQRVQFVMKGGTVYKK